MKTRLDCTSFNGTGISCRVELFLDGMPDFSDPGPDKPGNYGLPEGIYAAARNRVLETLQQLYPGLEIETITFRILSRDLENLASNRLIPDNEQLVSAVSDTVLQHITDALGTNPSLPLEQKLKELPQKEAAFRKLYLQETDINKKRNPDLERALRLFEEKKYAESFRLLTTVSSRDLTEKERQDFTFLQFALLLKNSDRLSPHLEKNFQEKIAACEADPRQAKRYYFAYIRFAEDCRDPRRPRELIREFTERYPRTILEQNELALISYLEGRAEYARGEFLAALEFLSQARVNCAPDDRKMIAAILNTAVNSFTDNLFFDEAWQLAETALEIRRLLNLPERFETLSCMGGIACKQGDFVRARDYYRESEQLASEYTLTATEQNRLYNYLAKVSALMDDYDSAAEYLVRARAAGDRHGFSTLIEMLILERRQEYDALNQLFRKTLMLPENHRDFDNFVLGWGYTFQARASFARGNYRDGVIYLADAVEFLCEDLYILEAAAITLCLYIHKVPAKHIRIFRDLESNVSIYEQFSHYVEKHATIKERFFPLLHSPGAEKEGDRIPNLKQFYEHFAALDDDNYSPAEADSLFNAYCLL
jgi:tetratricopeptide (TPR) repeat protein